MKNHIRPEFVSIPVAAKLSSFTPPTIRKAILRGVLPCKKIRLDGPGTRASVRIRYSDLIAWIESGEDN